MTDIQQTEYSDLRNKFFFLDHTAEVLENYRRIQENQIFDRVLHDGRMKRAYLKKEGRQSENLIADFKEKFGDYKYLEGTDGSTTGANSLSAVEFTQQRFVRKHMKDLALLQEESILVLQDPDNRDQEPALLETYQQQILDGKSADPRQQPGLLAKEKTAYLQYREGKNEY